MSIELYRLVYVSKSRIRGNFAEIAEEIAGILLSSQSNNARVAITGALIFNTGIFAQVLEGDRRDVEATFERIQRDRRHGDLQVLEFAQASGRRFPSWSMGYVGRSREGQDLFGRMGQETGFEAKRLEGERIFEVIYMIALEEEARAA
ncbi:BLUF domain-containing protein [Rhodopseudomonas sp. P2A-2r]|uniref:BLUF domain-containing protein n=1 Tax=unclassified Rhodopseudomonas TaxID=2638247 RepID=UPI002234B275|nr:BLUF domain-containing protein [Rhodopseudomonas sp. P2A-2r]UZE49005.1 BLUF domain-containing protein [Rhodopseudomonas sp. P2A-2r]